MGKVNVKFQYEYAFITDHRSLSGTTTITDSAVVYPLQRYFDHVTFLNPLLSGNPKRVHRQTVQTQIRRRIMRRLIRVSTVC